jgi:hypothetical protein
MSDMTRDDVVALFGPLPDIVIAELIGTGATREEMAAARDWVAKDKAHTNPEHRLKPGAFAHVVEIIERHRWGPARTLFGDAGSTLE